MDRIAQLSAVNVSKSFMQAEVKIEVLDAVTVSFEQGVSYAITGASGIGKSTFAQIIVGLDEPTSGEIFYNDRNLLFMSERERNFFLNETIGLVFQSPHLIKELTVLENIILPGMVRGKTKEMCLEHGLNLLKEVKLEHKAHAKPAALSVGQQQRVVLCRALFNNPTFLIADEPTGALDSITAQSILQLMVAAKQKHAMGMIVVTHDERVAQAMDVIYVIEQGKFIQRK